MLNEVNVWRSPGLAEFIDFNVADKAEATTKTLVDGALMYIRSDDGKGNTWQAVTGAAPGTYSDDGGAFCGTVFIPTGGDGSNAWVRDYDDQIQLRWFDTTADWSLIQTAINLAEGKTVYGEYSATYTIQGQGLEIRAINNVTLDFRGANIIDDVQDAWPATAGTRPLIWIEGCENIKVGNFRYTAAPTRDITGGFVNIINIGITAGQQFWNDSNGFNDIIGGVNITSQTKNITVENIYGADFATGTAFFSVQGNSFNLNIRNINLYGDCKIGINIEAGLFPTDWTTDLWYTTFPGITDEFYGVHPYNIVVESFNGFNNSESNGFLRTAGCYNVEFRNCYGYNVEDFIWTWTSDRSIVRMPQNVTFNRCNHYASNTFVAATNVITLISPDTDGSHAQPLPAEPATNYDHTITFNNCELQGNVTTGTNALRFIGCQGHTVFNSCTLRDSSIAANIKASTGIATYVSLHSLTFNECQFIGNDRDAEIIAEEGVSFRSCRFKNGTGAQAAISLESNSYYTLFDHCKFIGLGGAFAYIDIDATSVDSLINHCEFDDPGAANINALTRLAGSNNISAGQLSESTTASDITHYGLQGQQDTMEYSLNLFSGTAINYGLRDTYHTAVSTTQTITTIIGGNIGDIVYVSSSSSLSTITFTGTTGSPGTSAIITTTGANVVYSGRFVVMLKKTSFGWYLHV